jgi:FkbH-like protein
MPKIELVIWDLDNTLWDGTVFYRDKETIELKPGTKAALKELDKRGITCAVCSKNEFKDAEEMLDKFEIKKYFKDFKISWGKKSEAVLQIIEKFNVSPERALFIDDDEFQKAEVVDLLPGLNTLSLDDPLDVLNVEGVIPENATNIDKDRVIILKQQRDREKEEKCAGNYKKFLHDCNIQMRVRQCGEEDLDRVVQLLNRTNELNATVNRYILEQITKEFKEGKVKVFVSELQDKFGEYGIIAEAILEPQEGGFFIRDLAVSCRTLGRGIGGAMLVAVLNYAKSQGVKKLTGYIKETEANWRLRPLFEKRNFHEAKKEGGKIFYDFFFDKDEIVPYPPHLTVELENENTN